MGSVERRWGWMFCKGTGVIGSRISSRHRLLTHHLSLVISISFSRVGSRVSSTPRHWPSIHELQFATERSLQPKASYIFMTREAFQNEWEAFIEDDTLMAMTPVHITAVLVGWGRGVTIWRVALTEPTSVNHSACASHLHQNHLTTQETEHERGERLRGDLFIAFTQKCFGLSLTCLANIASPWTTRSYLVGYLWLENQGLKGLWSPPEYDPSSQLSIFIQVPKASFVNIYIESSQIPDQSLSLLLDQSFQFKHTHSIFRFSLSNSTTFSTVKI